LIRLYVEPDLVAERRLTAGEGHSHYLAHVMRLREGDQLALFNGRDGEWLSRLDSLGRRDATLVPLERLREQTFPPDVELLVAVVKRPRLEVIAEKAAELGAARLLPLTTARTNAGRANPQRLRTIAVEAAEQTGRLDVPQILPQAALAEVLEAWPAARRLLFCDEAGGAEPIAEALAAEAPGQPWSILIGPEGGFTPAERAAIRVLPGALAVSLGPRILRADTAAIAALSLWQAALGDWRGA
jgi:16S rRNA (uracil1498-N3)-methyltransferase